jgi:hypothetical protein
MMLTFGKKASPAEKSAQATCAIARKGACVPRLLGM